MKDTKYFARFFTIFICLTGLGTIINASPSQANDIIINSHKDGETLKLQKELNKGIHKPILVASPPHMDTRVIKTIRYTWSSIDGSDYEARPVGNRIRLTK
jgi:hypothetical protein